MIDFSGSKSRRKENKIPDFPVTVFDATGGLLQDQNNESIFLVCGGDGIDACYYIRTSSSNCQHKQWTRLDQTMGERRSSAASIVIHNDTTLWITGGFNGSKQLKTTELISISSSKQNQIQPGPDLPFVVRRHCLVKLNSTTAMMIGGISENYEDLKSTYFLDIPTTDGLRSITGIVKGPDLSATRYGHDCVVLTDPRDENRQIVVVAGGCCSGNVTEMLVVGSSEHVWTRGPDLPKEIFHAASVTSPDNKSYLLVGGADRILTEYSSIFKLEYNANEGDWVWSTLKQKLKLKRRLHVALLVPDSPC